MKFAENCINMLCIDNIVVNSVSLSGVACWQIYSYYHIHIIVFMLSYSYDRIHIIVFILSYSYSDSYSYYFFVPVLIPIYTQALMPIYTQALIPIYWQSNSYSDTHTYFHTLRSLIYSYALILICSYTHRLIYLYWYLYSFQDRTRLTKIFCKLLDYQLGYINKTPLFLDMQRAIVTIAYNGWKILLN